MLMVTTPKRPSPRGNYVASVSDVSSSPSNLLSPLDLNIQISLTMPYQKPLPTTPPPKRTVPTIHSQKGQIKRRYSSPSPSPPRHERIGFTQDKKHLLACGTVGTNSQAASGSNVSTTSTQQSQGESVSPPSAASSTLNIPSLSRQAEIDPFTSGQTTYGGGFEYRPIVKYYNLPNKDAQDEYLTTVAPPINDLLKQMNYASFCVGFVHAGYARESAAPIVYVCAKDLEETDAKDIISTFESMNCEHISRCFCFKGDTDTYVAAERLTRYQEQPEMGASAGVRNGKMSFSLGAFFHFENESDSYFITVQHGVVERTDPATAYEGSIPIQQPSDSDFLSLREEYLRIADDGPTSRYRQPSSYWHGLISALDVRNRAFGVVHDSEFEYVDAGIGIQSCDWAVVRVESSRTGMNYITHSVLKDSVEPWGPTDGTRIFVAGEAEIDFGMNVIKAGRSTGVTTGEISLIYAFAKLHDADRITYEYTVVAEFERGQFASPGDSGAMVLNSCGRIVGMVIGGSTGRPMTLQGHEHLGPLYISYVTPFTLLKNRIEQKVGKVVKIDVADFAELEEQGVEIWNKS